MQFTIFRLRRKIIADFPQRAIHKTVVAHYEKTEMTKQILTYIIWIFSLSAFSQESDSIKINRIDSQVSKIPENPTKEDAFEIIQSSGLISKKKFLLFKKRIGSFHENIVYKNGEIHLIKIYTNLPDISTIEYYYYNNDELIHYLKKTEKVLKNNQSKKNITSAYFNNKKLITVTENVDFDVNEVLTKSHKNKSDWKEFINQTE